MSPLLALAQTLTLPSWAVAILVSTFALVLGFAWRLAVKAEKSADKLESAVGKLQALESRIAVIAILETRDAVRETEMKHMRQDHERLSGEVDRLRDNVHKLLRAAQRVAVEES